MILIGKEFRNSFFFLLKDKYLFTCLMKQMNIKV